MSPTPLKLLSSMATRELLAELATDFTRQYGQPIHAAAGGGVDIGKRVQAGEAADLVVLADNAINKLLASGQLVGARVDLVKSGVAIAVRAGAARPDISNEAALRQAVLSARTLSYSTGPSGVYLESLFARWGILDEIRPRIVVPPPGTPVGSLVASGDSELGFQQLSELMNLPGIEVLGPLPAEVQSITVFSGAVAATSANPAAAQQLLAYLSSPATNATKHRHGMTAA